MLRSAQSPSRLKTKVDCYFISVCVCVCACLCVCVREREKERVCACVCVCTRKDWMEDEDGSNAGADCQCQRNTDGSDTDTDTETQYWSWPKFPWEIWKGTKQPTDWSLTEHWWLQQADRHSADPGQSLHSRSTSKKQQATRRLIINTTLMAQTRWTDRPTQYWPWPKSPLEINIKKTTNKTQTNQPLTAQTDGQQTDRPTDWQTDTVLTLIKVSTGD